MYRGQPIPSTLHHIARAKISDGKSVVVMVPESTTVEAGKFYLLDGFFGVAATTVKTAAGETTEVVLLIEQGEYETEQINSSQAFAKGTLIYFDESAGKFDEDNTGNRLVGRVTASKDNNNVIWFILGPQI